MMDLISVRDILKCGTTVTVTTGHIHDKAMAATQEIPFLHSYLGPADTAVIPFLLPGGRMV